MKLFYFFIAHFMVGLLLIFNILPFDDFFIFVWYAVSGNIIMILLAMEGDKK